MVHSGMNKEYIAKHEKQIPIRWYYVTLIALLVVIAIEVAMVVFNTMNSVIHGTVVDKVGQYTPVTTWLINEKRYTREEPTIAMKGWHIIISDGDKFQTVTVSKKQYDRLHLNDSVWNIGSLVFMEE